MNLSEVGGKNWHLPDHAVVARYSSQASGNNALALPEEVVENALRRIQRSRGIHQGSEENIPRRDAHEVLRIIAEPMIDLTQPHMCLKQQEWELAGGMRIVGDLKKRDA